MAPSRTTTLVLRPPQQRKKSSKRLQVVVRPGQLTKLKRKQPRRKNKPTMLPRSGLAQAVRQFRLALKNPFSPDALGVRVVDSICYPTTVSHIRYKATCTTNVSGAFQALLLPFVHANAVLVAGSASGFPNVWANNTQIGYAVSPSTLSTYYSAFRVASWGVRIILTDSNLNAKGTYTLAPVMLGGYVPSESSLAISAAGVTNIVKAFGCQLPTEAISGMPGAMAVNAQDMMTRGEVVVRPMFYSNTAFNMKTVNDTSTAWTGTTYFTQGPNLVTLAGVVSTITQDSAGDANGQVGYMLSVANAPASTAEFQLEFIYHLEAIPQPSVGIVSTATASPSGSTTLVEDILSAFHTAGEYFAMGTGIADKLGDLGTKAYAFKKAMFL